METISKRPTVDPLSTSISPQVLADPHVASAGGLFTALGQSLDQALAGLLDQLLRWQGRQYERACLAALSDSSLRDVGLRRNRDGQLVRSAD